MFKILKKSFYFFRKLLHLAVALTIILTVHVCQGNVNEPLTHECLKYYLKNHQATEEIIDYVDNYIGSISDCESSVKTTLAGIYNKLRDRLSKDRATRAQTECVMREIEEENDEYEMLVLRETAVEMISGWRFWKYFSKSSRLEELQAAAENVIKKLILTCKGHQEFGYYFSQVQDRTISWARSGEQEYCIRKTLVDLNLMNDKIYNFKPNPKNVRTETLNCTIVFNEIKEDLLNEIKETKKVNDCTMNVYHKSLYAEYILKAELLSNLSLTSSDKTKEKQDFINSMVDITYDAKGC